MSGAFLWLHTIVCRVVVLIHVSRGKSTSRVVGRWSPGRGTFALNLMVGVMRQRSALQSNRVQQSTRLLLVGAPPRGAKTRLFPTVRYCTSTSVPESDKGWGVGRLTAYTRAGDWWRRESFVALPVPGASPSAGCSSNRSNHSDHSQPTQQSPPPKTQLLPKRLPLDIKFHRRK